MRISQLKLKLLVTFGYLALITILGLLKVPCIFQYLFSIPCPGCGMTRALLSALRFDFISAFRYHPMFWSLPILYLYFLSDNGIFHKKLWDTLLLCVIGIGFLFAWLINLR
ncbi:MAG: DUF2752 domain-containing protein [Ruminococcaceae bacterium]|nr:DUF2752 domain-containing protein [Oscillospiraceae bacterium]